MGKSSIRIIAIICIVSLIGLIVTQFFWVKKSIDVRNDTFYHSTRIALRSATNSIAALKVQGHVNTISPALSNDPKLDIRDYVSHCHFNSTLENEFCYYTLHKDYEYAIIDTMYNKTVYASNSDVAPESFLNSRYTWSLSGAFGTERFLLSVWFPNESRLITQKMTIWLLLVSGLFLLIVIIATIWTVSSLIRQKKVSEVKNDFVNNLTHEFKTPIATINAASEMLMKLRERFNDEKIAEYALIINQENKRLQQQVEQIMQTAIFDKEEIIFKNKLFDIHEVIKRTVDIYRIVIRDREGVIRADLSASRHMFYGDEIHFTNVLNNLIDNGVKYSKDTIDILIETFDYKKGVMIRVSDKGIGIASAHHKEIFTRLYRVLDGNIYQANGTGIGLYYVKRIVEAYKGKVSVESTPGEGASFSIYLPTLQTEA